MWACQPAWTRMVGSGFGLHSWLAPASMQLHGLLLALCLLFLGIQAQQQTFDRQDRDYRPLQFGKRDGYRPLQFGKREYRPLQFGKRAAAGMEAVFFPSI
ncbi:unnamed protein product, partial [Mesorhabditis spiculigera]